MLLCSNLHLFMFKKYGHESILCLLIEVVDTEGVVFWAGFVWLWSVSHPQRLNHSSA